MGRYWVTEAHAHRGHLASDDWLTPPWMVTLLGPFDLDPCAADPRPWDIAETHYTEADNGLIKPWHGCVWMNPPFGRGLDQWVRRLASHGNGMAILPLRSTDTRWFHEAIWQRADAVLFIRGRLRFYGPDRRESGPCPHASIIVAYGRISADRLWSASQTRQQQTFSQGRYLNLWTLGT
jgi:phage N-6-adenine-methyltransferase